MFDLSGLSLQQIKELEKQIEDYKKQNVMEAYKVSFYVKFNPNNHKNDMLTIDGEIDSGCFVDYVIDNIATLITEHFYLDGYDEKVCGIQVSSVSQQDVSTL
jgi:hypothetical protein